MNTLFQVALLMLFVSVSHAQTNLVAAPPHIRRSNGQVYDINRSILWQRQTLEFVKRTEGVVIARAVTYEDIFETRYYPGGVFPGGGRPGAYGSGDQRVAGRYKRVKIDTARRLGATIAITNLTRTDLIPGSEFTLLLISLGDRPIAGRKLELFDVGTTVYVEPRR